MSSGVTGCCNGEELPFFKSQAKKIFDVSRLINNHAVLSLPLHTVVDLPTPAYKIMPEHRKRKLHIRQLRKTPTAIATRLMDVLVATCMYIICLHYRAAPLLPLLHESLQQRSHLGNAKICSTFKLVLDA